MPEDERVATQAYVYSSLNVGFTLGAIIGGVALAFDNVTRPATCIVFNYKS